MSASPYIGVEQVAERYLVSPYTIHERARLHELPHRKLPGSRRLLFLPGDLDRFDDGCELEVVELPRGGRIVRPRGQR
jgi:hypothetical protein